MMLLSKTVDNKVITVNLANEVIDSSISYSGKFYAKCYYCGHEFIRNGSGEAKCPECGRFFLMSNSKERE
jgi:predicted RNA-binding Zn-ribbon protein involved in translation (DUF1610 family)